MAEEKRARRPHYQYFVNRECEYFPCHAGADPDHFSCLFCYCPLYALGSQCGGNFRWTEDGVKDCTGCSIPHDPDRYDEITRRYGEILEVAQERR